MNEITIILPEKVSLNVFFRKHYHSKNTLNHEFHLAIKEAIQKQKINPVKEYPISITFVFYLTGTLLDWDNCGGMVKALQDGLILEKVLENDSPKYIKQGLVVVEKSKRKYNYCVIELN